MTDAREMSADSETAKAINAALRKATPMADLEVWGRGGALFSSRPPPSTPPLPPVQSGKRRDWRDNRLSQLAVHKHAAAAAEAAAASK